MDIGGTHVTAALVEAETGAIVQDSRTYETINSRARAEEIFTAWTSAASHALRAANENPVQGIGLAMPGPFDYENGIALLRGVTKFESLYGLNIRQRLKTDLDLPPEFPVLFRNDAACFLLGEIQFGAARGHRDAIAITLGTGLGSAFLRNGELTENDPGMPPSGWLFDVPYRDGMADDFFSSRGLIRRFAQLGGSPLANVRELALQAPSEPTARKCFHTFSEDLADFLLPWVQSFRPTCLVVGGNIARAWELFGPTLAERLHTSLPDLSILVTCLFDTAALLGAASLPLRYHEPDPREQATP
jgi:glucokinase